MLEGVAALPGVTLHGIADPARVAERTPTFSVTVAGRSPREVAEALAADGVHVWDGDFYAYTLMYALGLAEDGGAVRAGLLHYTTEDEVDRLLAGLARLSLERGADLVDGGAEVVLGPRAVQRAGAVGQQQPGQRDAARAHARVAQLGGELEQRRRARADGGTGDVHGRGPHARGPARVEHGAAQADGERVPHAGLQQLCGPCGALARRHRIGAVGDLGVETASRGAGPW